MRRERLHGEYEPFVLSTQTSTWAVRVGAIHRVCAGGSATFARRVLLAPHRTDKRSMLYSAVRGPAGRLLPVRRARQGFTGPGLGEVPCRVRRVDAGFDQRQPDGLRGRAAVIRSGVDRKST